MPAIKELQEVKMKIFKIIASSAKDKDANATVRWSKAAEQCEKLIQELTDLDNRIMSFNDSLWQRQEGDAETAQCPMPKSDIRRSAKRRGLEKRHEWISKISTENILLTGHGTRYVTQSGKSLSIAFANELSRAQLKNKWFLGIKDEPTQVVVLLCQDLDGNLHDFILPVTEIKPTWNALGRNNGQIKFHILRASEGFVLLIPGGESLNITKYLGKYQLLKGHRI